MSSEDISDQRNDLQIGSRITPVCGVGGCTVIEIHMYMCVYIYTNVYISTYVYVHIYIYVYICVCIYMFIYVYTWRYMYIYRVHTISFQTFKMLLLYILWDDWPILKISASNEHLQQQLEYTLLKPDCHSWWISKMQSGHVNTLEERYAIKLFFKLEKKCHRNVWNASDCFRTILHESSISFWVV